jgi:hypothetical protein
VVEICGPPLGYALSPQFLKPQIMFKIKISGKDTNVVNPLYEGSFYNKINSWFPKTEVKYDGGSKSNSKLNVEIYNLIRDTSDM